MTKWMRIVLLGSVGAVCPRLNAAIIQVPADQPTIQAAINVAVNTDEIVVAPGTYNEAIDLLGKTITVRSSGGPAVTIIDAGGLFASVVTCQGGEGFLTLIQGFTITGGDPLFGFGGGMFNVDSFPSVDDCIFSGNHAFALGGAMYNLGLDASPSVSNCVFDGNVADAQGGAVFNDTGIPLFQDCTFSGNSANTGGAIYNLNTFTESRGCVLSGNIANIGGAFFNSDSNPTSINCVFTGNTAADGSAVFNDFTSYPKFINCTITENFGDTAHKSDNNSFATITSCILWNNTDQIEDLGGSVTTVNYSDVQGGAAGTGNIDVNPRFISVPSDLRLHRFSPCTDAGDNTMIPGFVVTDLDGNPRFVDDGGVGDSGNGTAPIVDMGAYERQEDSVTMVFNIGPGDSIQDTISASAHGDEIIVAAGTYIESIDFNGLAITLRSADGPAVTIIDGNGTAGVVNCLSGEGFYTNLIGFTITGGSGAYGGMLNQGSSPSVDSCWFIGNSATNGGGMRNSSGSNPFVVSCVFSQNSAANNGGGMYNFNSDPSVHECTFSQNTAQVGGAMYNNDCSPTVSLCTFSQNSASDGGGMFNDLSSPNLNRCTFSQNTASAGAGIRNINSNPALIDSILVGNDASNTGGGVENFGGSGSFVNCVFSGNEAFQGGAISNMNNAQCTVVSCTLSGNDDGGIRNVNNSTTDLTNSIVWGNVSYDIEDLDTSATTMTYSDVGVFGGVIAGGGGPGIISVDPLFVDPDGPDDMLGTEDDNLRVYGGSPCVDVGSNADVFVPDDVDGGDRILDGDLNGIATVDMGAYELDPAEAGVVLNLTQSTLHATIDAAIQDAVGGDALLASAGAFLTEPDIDFAGTAITLTSTGPVTQAAGGVYELTHGARLEAASGQAMSLSGQLRAETGALAEARAGQLTVDAAGVVVAREFSNLDLTVATAVLDGVTRVHEQATLTITGAVSGSGSLTLFPNGTLIADSTFDHNGFMNILDGGALFANGPVTNDGSMIVDTGEVNINTGLVIGSSGSMTLNASDLIAGNTCTNGGNLIVNAATATVSGLTDNTGTMTLLNGTLYSGPVTTSGLLGLTGATVFASGLTIETGGRLNTSGEIYSAILNDEEVFCLGDTLVVGDYTNNGTTIVQIGTLTIIGTLIDNGTIIGNVVGGAAAGGGTSPGDGMLIAGDYVAAGGASLIMADALWRFTVGGDFDVAIDDHDRYHLALAELHLDGLNGAVQWTERMSSDVGPDPSGLDRTLPGHYPIGTLRVGPGATTVNLVDQHDNDGLGQGSCEAVYVEHLIVEPAATLNTNGCPVYYLDAQIDGTIDDPFNLVEIVVIPPCPADLDGDGNVGITDFLILLAMWGTDPGGPPDLDGDGNVGITDFLLLLANWGPC